MKSKLYIVRHTQTIGNIEHRLTGRADYEITEEGKKYIKKMETELEKVKFDSAYSSTSDRTKKTIQSLADKNNIEIKQLDELCEMYFGIYDGMKWDDVNKINPKINDLHRKTNEIKEIPGQETTEEVAERMYNILRKIANNNLEKNVLICSHGVAIEAFLRKVTKEPFLEKVEEYSQKNTSINIVEYDNKLDKFQILKLNEISHLKHNSIEER